MKAIFEYERKVKTEDKLIYYQYDYNPTKLTKKLQRENISVHDIGTYPDEENVDCIPTTVGIIPVSKNNLLLWLTKGEALLNLKKKTDVHVQKGEDCFDEILNHIYSDGKSDPKKN